MSLSTKLAGNFTKNIRKRGDDYYRKGRVSRAKVTRYTPIGVRL